MGVVLAEASAWTYVTATYAITIGLLGGLITGISPCILPVLPVIFLTGGAQSARFDGEAAPARRSRPFLVIAGLVLSFTLVTLVGSLLLGLLGMRTPRRI